MQIIKLLVVFVALVCIACAKPQFFGHQESHAENFNLNIGGPFGISIQSANAQSENFNQGGGYYDNYDYY